MAKEMLLGVADVLILDDATGMQIASATLSSHTIEQTVDSTDLRGGRTNKLIGRLKTNKSLSVTVEDLQQTKEMQALMSGDEVVTTPTLAFTMPKEVDYTTNGIELDPKLKDGTPIFCYDLATGKQYVTEIVPGGGGNDKLKVGEDGTGGNSAGNVVQELGDGTPVLLGAYRYDTANNEENFSIRSDKFAKNVSIVLEEDVYDGETMEIIKVKQTIIPLATPDENFSLSGSAEIGETTASYTFTALASGDCENLLGYVVYLEPKDTGC